MPDFKNRFPQLAKWEDRIADADYYGDFDPVRFREDPDLMKYDIFLAPGWTWEYTGNWQDCHATETFRTLADAKKALRDAVKMDPGKEPCKGCPRFKDCHPDAAKKEEEAKAKTEAKASKPAPAPEPRKGNSPKITTVFDPATVEALNARAKADGVKVSDLIRRLVADGLGLKDGGAMRAAHRPRKAR